MNAITICRRPGSIDNVWPGLSQTLGCLMAALAWLLLSATTTHATTTVVSFWRLGENDPGAVNGVTATNTTDTAGGHNLTVVGAASYTNDVAATAPGSWSVNFAGSGYALGPVVSTVTDVANVTNGFQLKSGGLTNGSSPRRRRRPQDCQGRAVDWFV